MMMDDYKLLHLVKQEPILYDKAQEGFKNKPMKCNTWEIIASQIGNVSGEDCQKRFKCLRDRFAKEKKTRKKEMARDPHLPRLFSKMMFLWNHVSHRKLPYQDRKSYDDDYLDSDCNDTAFEPVTMLVEEDINIEETENQESDSNIVPFVFADPLTSTEANSDSTPLPRIKSETEDMLLKPFEFTKQESKTRTNELNRSFGLLVAGLLDRMPKERASMARIKLLTVLHEMQFGNQISTD